MNREYKNKRRSPFVDFEEEFEVNRDIEEMDRDYLDWMWDI